MKARLAAFTLGVWLLAGTAPAADEAVTALAAGDIASCGLTGDSETAALLARLPGSVLALGDIAYESGSERDFRECYDPTWGSVKDRTRPVPGNHDYGTPGAAPYFAYFGASAGEAGRGYYSFDLGAWHLIALNSNIAAGPGSPQEEWLRADLRASKADCILAYWHHPLFSSGLHGNDSRSLALWKALYERGASLVLNGHDHDYERFAPQDPYGKANPARGIREFVIGTGGASLRPFSRRKANSEAREAGSLGVLRLDLLPGSYRWEFQPTKGDYRDSGSGKCVGVRQ